MYTKKRKFASLKNYETMMQVANPIYDIVFKYLMEDERIAKTLISSLLKKEVISIEQRRNE